MGNKSSAPVFPSNGVAYDSVEAMNLFSEYFLKAVAIHTVRRLKYQRGLDDEGVPFGPLPTFLNDAKKESIKSFPYLDHSPIVQSFGYAALGYLESDGWERDVPPAVPGGVDSGVALPGLASAVRIISHGGVTAPSITGGLLPNALYSFISRNYRLDRPPTASEPLDRGYLYKLGVINRTYKKRYFVGSAAADNFSIFYYNRDAQAAGGSPYATRTNPNGYISPCGHLLRLHTDEKDVAEHGPHSLCLQSVDVGRKWHLRFDTPGEFEKWVRLLSHSALRSRAPSSLDSILYAAFLDALHRTRRRLGLISPFAAHRRDTEQLALLLLQSMNGRLTEIATYIYRALLGSAASAAEKDAAAMKTAFDMEKVLAFSRYHLDTSEHKATGVHTIFGRDTVSESETPAGSEENTEKALATNPAASPGSISPVQNEAIEYITAAEAILQKSTQAIATRGWKVLQMMLESTRPVLVATASEKLAQIIDQERIEKDFVYDTFHDRLIYPAVVRALKKIAPPVLSVLLPVAYKCHETTILAFFAKLRTITLRAAELRSLFRDCEWKANTLQVPLQILSELRTWGYPGTGSASDTSGAEKPLASGEDSILRELLFSSEQWDDIVGSPNLDARTAASLRQILLSPAKSASSATTPVGAAPGATTPPGNEPAAAAAHAPSVPFPLPSIYGSRLHSFLGVLRTPRLANALAAPSSSTTTAAAAASASEDLPSTENFADVLRETIQKAYATLFPECSAHAETPGSIDVASINGPNNVHVPRKDALDELFPDFIQTLFPSTSMQCVSSVLEASLRDSATAGLYSFVLSVEKSRGNVQPSILMAQTVYYIALDAQLRIRRFLTRLLYILAAPFVWNEIENDPEAKKYLQEKSTTWLPANKRMNSVVTTSITPLSRPDAAAPKAPGASDEARAVSSEEAEDSGAIVEKSSHNAVAPYPVPVAESASAGGVGSVSFGPWMPQKLPSSRRSVKATEIYYNSTPLHETFVDADWTVSTAISTSVESAVKEFVEPSFEAILTPLASIHSRLGLAQVR